MTEMTDRRRPYVDLLSVDLLSVDLLSVDLLSVDLLSVDLLSVDLHTYRPSACLPSVGLPSVRRPSVHPSAFRPSVDLPIYRPSVDLPSIRRPSVRRPTYLHTVTYRTYGTCCSRLRLSTTDLLTYHLRMIGTIYHLPLRVAARPATVSSLFLSYDRNCCWLFDSFPLIR